MEKNLFRKESVDRISSPEELHDYMRVTSPRLWMLLSAILVLLIGFIVFACSANMESTMPITVRSEYDVISADLPISRLELIKIRMPVRVNGYEGYISNIDQETRLQLDISYDGDAAMPDGLYDFFFAEDVQDASVSPEDASMFLYVSNGSAVLHSLGASEQLNAFQKERRVIVDGKLGTVTHAEMYDGLFISISLNERNAHLADGVYEAEIVTESTTPISFLLN